MPLINPGGSSGGSGGTVLDDYPVLATEQGFKAWSLDPASVNTQQTLTSGRLTGARLYNRKAQSFSKLHVIMSTAAASVTAGQAFMCLYSGAGNLLQSADCASVVTSLNQTTVAIPTQPMPVGPFFICMYVVATTPGAIRAGSPSTVGNVFDGAFSDPRFFLADTGLTTAPPATIGTKTAANSFWFAAS